MKIIFREGKKAAEVAYKNHDFVILIDDCDNYHQARVLAIEETRAKVSISLSGGVSLVEWVTF